MFVMNLECFLFIVVLLHVLWQYFLSISPNRTENTEANLPESQEFLSGIEDKKTTRFTDVSSNTIGQLDFLNGIIQLIYAIQYLHVLLDDLTCLSLSSVLPRL